MRTWMSLNPHTSLQCGVADPCPQRRAMTPTNTRPKKCANARMGLVQNSPSRQGGGREEEGPALSPEPSKGGTGFPGRNAHARSHTHTHTHTQEYLGPARLRVRAAPPSRAGSSRPGLHPGPCSGGCPARSAAGRERSRPLTEAGSRSRAELRGSVCTVSTLRGGAQ